MRLQTVCSGSASREVQTGHEEKVLRREGGQSLEQVPHGSGNGTKAVEVQGASGQCCQLYRLVLGRPARNRELDSMTLMSPFQLKIFYDSMILQHFQVVL